MAAWWAWWSLGVMEGDELIQQVRPGGSGEARATGRREGAEVGRWLGMAGADAAAAARASGLVPAMEMVRGDGEPGVVVGQDPAPGELVAHGAMVVLQVGEERPRRAAPTEVATVAEAISGEGPDGGGDVPGEWWGASYDGADGEALGFADRREGDLGEWSPQDAATEELQFGEAGIEPGTEAGPRGAAGVERAEVSVSRVRWMLVVGGWRVCWWEAAGICVLALTAAWSLGGGGALAGLAGAAVVVGVGVLAASLAGRGEERRPGEAGAVVIETGDERRRR